MITPKSYIEVAKESIEVQLAEYADAIEAYRVWLEDWRERQALSRQRRAEREGATS